MPALTPASERLPWHRRLEARVMAVLGLLVTVALASVVTSALGAVASQSRARALDELEAARAAFDAQVQSRATAAAAASRLVTELPVFRAHLTDARLAADGPTIAAMADGYRRDLGAQFAVVTDSRGDWLGSPGWAADDGDGRTPAVLRPIIAGAVRGEGSRALVMREGTLFLAVSTPARFADEILGTLTTGYALNGAVAEQLAHLAHCEVVLLVGGRVAATSVESVPAGDIAALAVRIAAGGRSARDGLYPLGSRHFVAGAFPLALDGGREDGRLVLLSDFGPTEAFVARLRSRLLAGSAAVFVLVLIAAFRLSRSVSQPLHDLASAAEVIAAGDLSLELPVRGSAEAVTVAQAFNGMSASLREARDRLLHDAIHDPLTQLPNRVLVMERIERAMGQRSRHSEHRVAVLFVDLDRFKHVNDSLGHAAGDRLLVAYAARITGVLRRDDLVGRSGPPLAAGTVARFGGDEFVILLDDLRDPLDAIRVAERVRHVSAQPLRVDGNELFVTASIGVAVSSPAHTDGGDLIRDADLAMYRAKATGGGAYAVFDNKMHDAAVERFRLETELRQAVDRSEFRLWYQPIVSLDDGRLTGVEALIRWQHPTRGLLTPGVFLPVAEQMGGMAALDEWVLREACRQGRAWQKEHPDRPPLTMSVNVSTKAFASSSLVSLVEDVLGSTALPASALRLEITEGAAMADPERARMVLSYLRRLGVRVSLDDFGTGYCSLSYLQQFTVDTLKIDRSFVMRIGEGEQRTEIVELIANLAGMLGLDIVAEGAETAAQVDYLRRLGCHYGQGYYFSPPVPPEQVWSHTTWATAA